MFPDFGTQLFHPFVFQAMQQGLVFAPFAEVEKGGRLFNLNSSVE